MLQWNYYVRLKVCIKLLLMEVQGVSRLLLASAKGCGLSLYIFLLLPRIPLVPTIRGTSVCNSISSFTGTIGKKVPICIMVWWHSDDNACVQIFCKPMHFFTTQRKFVFFWVYMNLLILYGHMDLFAILCSERALHYSLCCMGTTLLNQALSVNWGCSL